MGYAKLGFAALIVTIVAALVVMAMFMDKDDLARDLIKISVSLVAGAFGGYGFAKAQSRRSNDEDE